MAYRESREDAVPVEERQQAHQRSEEEKGGAGPGLVRRVPGEQEEAHATSASAADEYRLDAAATHQRAPAKQGRAKEEEVMCALFN